MSSEEEADEKNEGEVEAEVVGVPTVIKFEGHEAALGKSPDFDDGEYERLVPPTEPSDDTYEES